MKKKYQLKYREISKALQNLFFSLNKYPIFIIIKCQIIISFNYFCKPVKYIVIIVLITSGSLLEQKLDVIIAYKLLKELNNLYLSLT